MVCRLIFRKSNGALLVKTVYENYSGLPTLNDELRDFTKLNGYNPEAITIVDITDDDERFTGLTKSKNIKLVDGDLHYDCVDEPTEEFIVNPTQQVNDKLDVLLRMHLEREGII